MHEFLNIRNIAYLIIVSFCITLSILINDRGVNYLLIGVISFISFIVFRFPSIYKFDILVLLFIFSIIICTRLNINTFRWSTVLYTILFCFAFVSYLRLLYTGKFTANDYLNIIKILLYAYCIVLVIQQVCVLVGFPIFNASAYSLWDKWKLNSLASESSLAARFIALLMFCYLSIKEITTGKKYELNNGLREDKYVWISFFYTMLTLGSSTAFVFIPLIFLKIMHLRNLVPFLLLTVLMVFLFVQLGGEAFHRVFRVLSAIITLDEEAIIKADHSASIRIVPIIMCIKMLNPMELNFWIGHGIDYLSEFFYKIFPGIPKGFYGGGMIAFIIEYGMIPFLAFLVILIRYCFSKNDWIGWLFLILLVFIGGINTQIVWATLILFASNKYFLMKSFPENDFQKIKLS